MDELFDKEIADVIRIFLDEGDWQYHFDDENGIFRFGIRMHGNLNNVLYTVCDNEHDFTMYVI